MATNRQGIDVQRYKALAESAMRSAANRIAARIKVPEAGTARLRLAGAKDGAPINVGATALAAFRDALAQVADGLPAEQGGQGQRK